ncbi:MAG: hypothetical protein E5X72_00165 [Mesorhizobium sp.]|uniref:hypothetical protein n=1 Tax=Mesorhizobium sp. TaxID=1871066 RepID=UPI00121643A8|nr:hypothetical protein [Mesorhizobium sp.]TIP06663.1 MAG: hypothetical protein E5X72_00165 [Mesorhizobium sp.]
MEAMNANTAKDAFLESAWVLVLSRSAMLAMPILLALVVFFGRFWIESQFEAQAAITTQLRSDVNELSNEMPDLKERTKVLENNQDRGRQEQQEFQQIMREQMGQVINQQQSLAQQIAALTAMIQAQQRELDKR